MDEKNSVNEVAETIMAGENTKEPLERLIAEAAKVNTRQQFKPIVGDTAMREQGKVPFDLVPPEFTAMIALVLEHGAKKYAPHNFEKGLPFDDLIRGALSHTLKLQSGEIYDADSGLYHASHAAWNMLAFGMMMMRAPQLEKIYSDGVARRKIGQLQTIADEFTKTTGGYSSVKVTEQPSLIEAINRLRKQMK